MPKLTPYDDRFCPIYKEIIDGELCYETALCMQGQFKISSIPESVNITVLFCEQIAHRRTLRLSEPICFIKFI